MFFPILSFSFSFTDGFLCCAEAFFGLHSSTHLFLLLTAFAFGVKSKESMPISKDNAKEFTAYVFS